MPEIYLSVMRGSGATAVPVLIKVGSDGTPSEVSLEGLRPPSSLAPLHQQVLTVIAKGITYFDALLTKLKAGTLTQAQFLAGVDRSPLDKQENALWKKLGVKVCVG